MKLYTTTLICLVFGLTAQAQLFAPLANSPVTTTPGDSRSINIVDLNNDGLDDLYITNGLEGGQNNECYINLGNGQFKAITNDPIVQDYSPSDGATCADTDNDGDLDCFMVTWYGKRNFFYINTGDTTFQHLANAITGNLGTYSETATFGDYDNDGLIDVYITNSEGDKRNMLYRNTGNNVFTKVTANWLNEALPSRGAAWSDFDNDGDQDLYVANEGTNANSLFKNNGTGALSKLSNDPAVQEAHSSMTVSWGDVNNDGFPDLFVGNAGYFQSQTNRLFINNGNGGFTAAPAGPINTDASTTYGSAFADYDNDGDLDLFAANGYHDAAIVNFLYNNNGSGQFTRDLTALPNYSTPCSFGTAWGDLDNNGFQDLVVATCKNNPSDPQPTNMVWMNNGNGNHWIKFRLVGTISNAAAIGAKIRLFATINGQNLQQLREISAQTGYCGQNSLIVHFGLGAATAIDSVRVEWPAGSHQTLVQVEADTLYMISEQSGSNSTTAAFATTIQLKAAPNPASERLSLTIITEIVLSNVEYSLINAAGAVCSSSQIGTLPTGDNNIALSIKGLPAGQYWIRLTATEGTATLPLNITPP